MLVPTENYILQESSVSVSLRVKQKTLKKYFQVEVFRVVMTMQQDPTKRWYPITTPQGVTTLKTST
jgi:hypothetical protein